MYFWEDVGEFLVGLFGIVVVGFIIIFGICYLISIPTVGIFNKAYGTNYSTLQWVCGEETIKNYIGDGKVTRIDATIK